VFLISLVHHHHLALLHRQTLADSGQTVDMSYGVTSLNPPFLKGFLRHSHLSLAQALLLEFDHSFSGHWRW